MTKLFIIYNYYHGYWWAGCAKKQIIIWQCHQTETFSKLLAFCAGNSPVTGEFLAQRPVTRSFDVCFDLRLNQQLSKQWRHLWFKTLSRSLWRHCNALAMALTEPSRARLVPTLYLTPVTNHSTILAVPTVIIPPCVMATLIQCRFMPATLHVIQPDPPMTLTEWSTLPGFAARVS